MTKEDIDPTAIVTVWEEQYVQDRIHAPIVGDMVIDIVDMSWGVVTLQLGYIYVVTQGMDRHYVTTLSRIIRLITTHKPH
jgi:hypothetical protein